MADNRRRTCRTCGGHHTEVGPISWAGNCESCGMLKLERNVLSLNSRSGEAFKEWRRSVAASVGAVLLDDLPKGA